MLFNPDDIISSSKPFSKEKPLPASLSSCDTELPDFISGILDKHIGIIENGKTIHYWSFGNFNMIRLIFHILNNIGSADIIMSSYGISPKTIEGIINRQQKGVIKRFRLLIDNRVKSISPKPFDMIVRNFDYRCTSIHAKVACISNEQHKITVISSQNATDNPKAERGIIYTDLNIFAFDFKNLETIYDNGTT